MTMAEPAPVAARDWPGALRRACEGVGLRAVYQPLVDLHRGLVVGYEALIRFAGADEPTGEARQPGSDEPAEVPAPEHAPERWFAAARALGCEAELEAAALATTLPARDELPPDTFLSVNVSPTTLASGPVTALFDEQQDLRGLVLELTEHAPVDSYRDLSLHLDRYRERGALVAIDDAGAGYAGLAHLLELRPAIVKLDRALVSGVDRDEAKRTLVEMLGLYAGHLDAWVLAEGIETLPELETLRSLGVPLGQGWALGYPRRPWATMDDRAVVALRSGAGPPPEAGCRIGMLVERAVTVSRDERATALADTAGLPADAFVVLIDEYERPVATVTPGGASRGRTGPVLAVSLSTPVTDVAFRSLTRACEYRFEPVVCTDPAGRTLGIVRIERVIEHLARVAGSTD
jgi:EAL domain-containing protein (putative c-di-GMP-specific phosphodiesterase class I)